VAYHVHRAGEYELGTPSWRPEEQVRRVLELSGNLGSSRANLWRYPPGARGRRHREPVQEEVFVVLEGTLTMLLGEPPEPVVLTPQSIVVVEPGTPLQLRNESEADVVLFAYGAPQEPPGRAEILEQPD
jgi:mannose-6-phosphate isomerase-like protein (cupin superfamily)